MKALSEFERIILILLLRSTAGQVLFLKANNLRGNSASLQVLPTLIKQS